MPGEKRVTRRRFFWGVAFLVLGATALLVNLKIMDIRDWYESWPFLLIVLGLLQLIWPGTARERLGGYWLLAVGVYGYVSVFNVLGLNFASASPILLVAVGLRIVLSGFFPDHDSTARGPGGPSAGQGGAS